MRVESVVPPMDRARVASVYTELEYPRDGTAALRITAADAADVLGREPQLRGFVDGVYHTVVFAKRGAAFCAAVFRDTGASAPAATRMPRPPPPALALIMTG